jgi:uncharacterized protein YbaP (TraB family)
VNKTIPRFFIFAGLAVIAASTALVFFSSRDSGIGQLVAKGIAYEATHRSKPNGRVILLGSMHALTANDVLPPNYLTAIQAADEIIFELDPATKNSPDAAKTIARHTAYADGTSWRDHVEESTARQVDAFVAAEGVRLESLKQKRTFMVAQVLSKSRFAKAGFSSRFGVEAQLIGPARQTGKPIGGLETLESQLQVFSSMTEAEEEAVLLKTLGELGTTADFGLRIAQAWREGDIGRLTELTNESIADYPDLAARLFSDRNERIAEILAERAAGNRTLTVIVGSAHLCGKESIVELLRERGFVVKKNGTGLVATTAKSSPR